MRGLPTFFGALGCAAFAAGCSAESFSKADAGPVTGGADANESPDAGVAPSVLPFAVDDWYGPSGYMGDGETPGAIVDHMKCLASRPNDWVGHCHQYTWTPGAKKWAGVYWQYPDGNWGDLPGLAVPAGAKKITFQAWGDTGTEKVDFVVGMKSVDGFQVTDAQVPLTTSPQPFTLDLSGSTYNKVVGGFGWSAKDSTTPVTFYIDDIRWE
jgi:hypothetical protein